jgi:riboflavin kinase/FMN adenylyltransferase
MEPTLACNWASGHPGANEIPCGVPGCPDHGVIFSPHPRRVLEPSKAFNLNLLTTLEEKKSRFALSGIDHLVILPFTQALSTLNYERFVKEYLWKPLHSRHISPLVRSRVWPWQGRRMEALSELGSELGFTVTKVAPVFHQGEIISSTRIRKALESGMIRQAEGMLAILMHFRQGCHGQPHRPYHWLSNSQY